MAKNKWALYLQCFKSTFYITCTSTAGFWISEIQRPQWGKKAESTETPEFHLRHRGECVCWGPGLRHRASESSCSPTEWNKHTSWPPEHGPTTQRGLLREWMLCCSNFGGTTSQFIANTQTQHVSPCLCLRPERGHWRRAVICWARAEYSDSLCMLHLENAQIHIFIWSLSNVSVCVCVWFYMLCSVSNYGGITSLFIIFIAKYSNAF